MPGGSTFTVRFRNGDPNLVYTSATAIYSVNAYGHPIIEITGYLGGVLVQRAFNMRTEVRDVVRVPS